MQRIIGKNYLDYNLYSFGDMSKNLKVLIIVPPMVWSGGVCVCTWVVGEIWDHPAKFGVSTTYGFDWPGTFRAEKEKEEEEDEEEEDEEEEEEEENQ